MNCQVIYVSPMISAPDVESVGMQVYKRFEKLYYDLQFWKIFAGIATVIYLVLQIYLLYLYLPLQIEGFELFDITVYYVQPLIVLATIVGVFSAIIAPNVPISYDAVVMFQWINYASLRKYFRLFLG